MGTVENGGINLLMWTNPTMTLESPKLPDWARKERQGDLNWIRKNLDIFQLVATAAFEDTGRGAIVVDTTSRPLPDKGHPFGYLSQEQIDEYDDEDIRRMVREYDPEQELVVVLQKSENRTSTYRVRPQRRGRQGS